MNTVKINSHTIELTHQDKVLFPQDNITKSDIIAYYQTVAPIMLPHMKNRPVTMHRFPDGIDSEGFYQKDIGDYFPAWIKRTEVPKQDGGHNTYVICNDAATLIYLANQACITPHIWLSQKPKLDYPDKMIFDLDPGKTDFTLVRKTALALHKLLETLGLTSYAMTTGSRGMHVIVPLDRKQNFDYVRACTRSIADHLVNLDGGKQLTTEIRLDKRKGRLFIDTTRNAFAQTTVAPYAIRALDGAPIATPVTWEEVGSPTLSAQKFTIKNIQKRLNKVGDPLADFGKTTHSLGSVMGKLA